MTASWDCRGPAALVRRAIDPDQHAGHAFGLDV
jgi:hypothetical protein